MCTRDRAPAVVLHWMTRENIRIRTFGCGQVNITDWLTQSQLGHSVCLSASWRIGQCTTGRILFSRFVALFHLLRFVGGPLLTVSATGANTAACTTHHLRLLVFRQHYHHSKCLKTLEWGVREKEGYHWLPPTLCIEARGNRRELTTRVSMPLAPISCRRTVRTC